MLPSTPIQHPGILPKQEIKNLLLVQSTGLVGREKEIASASALLQRQDVRLLTITGPGGVGKTSLALHVTLAVTEHFSAGVYRVSLSPLKDPELVIPAIAQELGLAEDGEEPLLQRVKTYLREKKLLLLLDNFEQVSGASLALTELLSSCHDLKIIVTSREILHIRIEHVFVLSPLALPDLKNLPDFDQISCYASIALFVQRARTVKPDFHLTPANASAIALICTRLDGLPLAIELAAARIKFLPLHSLLARLEHRLNILTDGARDLPRRQQTLRNTLSWSYDLLSPEEQLIFRLLSIFVRGCTLESVEYVYSALYKSATNVLPVIASLVDKSLIQLLEQPAHGEMRLAMLETVREYGQECLIRCNEANTVAMVHAQYYVNLVEKAELELRKEQQAEWLERLEQEYDDLRAALGWFLVRERPEMALRFCAALCPFWLITDRSHEGYQWMKKALALDQPELVAADLQARALLAAGTLASSQGEHRQSTDYWQRGLELYKQLDDQQGMARVLHKLAGNYARHSPAKAYMFYQKSLALAREEENLATTIDVLISLADETASFGDFARAREFFTEAVALARVLGDKRSIAYGLRGLGHIAIRLGAYAEAHTLLNESLALYRDMKDNVGTAFVLISLGIATLFQGDYKIAQALIDKSALTSQEMGNRHKVANYLSLLGEVALHSQRDESLLAHPLLKESMAMLKETSNEEGIASKLFTLGCLEYVQGIFPAAIQLLEESLALFTRQENHVMAAASLSKLGHVYARLGKYQRARALMEQSLNLTREIGARWIMSFRLSHLGLVLLNEGDHSRARVLMEEGVAVARETEDRRYIADALGVMGLLHLHEGDYPAALTCLEESLALAKEVEDSSSMAYRLADLGLLAIYQGQMEKARPLIEESLALSMQMNHQWFIASCLERLGEVVVAENQALWAAQLWGAAAAIRTALATPIPPIERAPYEAAVEAAHLQLGEELFATSWETGLSLNARQAIDLRPTMPDETRDTRPQLAIRLVAPLESDTSLTQRESEVLRLVAGGLTNLQIAEQLVISPRTVQTHLSSIYHKLAVSSRSGATRYAIEHNLA